MVVNHMSSLVLLDARTRDTLLLPLQETMHLAASCKFCDTKATVCPLKLPVQPFPASRTGTMQHACIRALPAKVDP